MSNQSNILHLGFTKEEGMVDDILMKAHLVTVITVLEFDYVCYAQIADHKQLRFFYNNGNYCSMGAAMSHCNWDNVLGTGDIGK